MIRAFLAIELNQEIRSALKVFQERLRNHLPPVNWVNPQSVHLTVKFLGEIDEEQISAIHQAVEHAIQNCPRFSLQFGGVGGFPNVKQPRVLWVGISGKVDALRNLASEVERALIPIGFPPESRPFRGHLTLARIKQPTREIELALVRSQALDPPPDFGTLKVNQLCLFRSDLKPTGAVYHRLFEIPLKEI